MRFIEDYCSQHAQQNQEQLSKLFISIDKFYFGQHGNLSQNSAEICSYYVLFRLPDTKSINTYIRRLPRNVLSSTYMQFALEAYVARQSANSARFFNLLTKCSYLQACLLFPFVGQMRYSHIEVICRALRPGRQEVRHSIQDLKTGLKFDDDDDVAEFVDHCGFEVDGDGYIQLHNKVCIDSELKALYDIHDDNNDASLSKKDIEEMLPVSEKDGVTPIRPRTRFMQVSQQLLDVTTMLHFSESHHDLFCVFCSMALKIVCSKRRWVVYVPVDLIEVFHIACRSGLTFSWIQMKVTKYIHSIYTHINISIM